ncbi:MAG: HAMP domain-containing histidine kinase, partial [Acidimicrobiia bacterium]|nr:HAMP domain-containing histidine kinase [Acidimicrobiia bacterium]
GWTTRRRERRMRVRLVVVAVAITSMVAIAFLVPLAILTRDLAADRERVAAERDAEQVARLAVFVPPDGGAPAFADLVGDPQFASREVSIVEADGTVWGAQLDPSEDLAPALAGATFRAPVVGGEAIYVPVVTSSGTVVVRAVADGETMRAGVARTWFVLVAVGVALVLIAVSVADRLGTSVVEPVRDLQSAAGRLGEGHLDVRVEPSGPPEISDVGRAFNQLATQVDDLLRSEREDVADLAHRLRTPLTAARLAAESVPDPTTRTQIFDQLDELHRVIDHIIDEARRVDRRTVEGYADLTEVVRDRTAFWEPLAADEGRTVTIDIAPAPALVAASDTDLAAAFDALIGNVFSHTPSGTGFSVATLVEGGSVSVVITDAGPGFPEGVDVTSRGASGGDSTGLGLAIAHRLAESCGGSLTLTAPPTTVTLTVPIAART